MTRNERINGNIRKEIERIEREINSSTRNDEPTTAMGINWEESINIQIRNIRTRIAKGNSEIQRIQNEIKQVEGEIAWQNNRSKQANTIIKRGF